VKGFSKTARGFTLVELLVVIGIIALLLSILIPTLSKARQASVTLKCLSNLRQCGLAFQMYAGANKQYLPYPTTTLISGDAAQGYLWFNAIDPYLASNTKGQELRTGVAANRTYKNYKQCPVYETFEGEKTAGTQTIYKEFARSYKMNSHLRRNNPSKQCKITDAKRNAEFVLLGDAISMDVTSFMTDGSGGGAFENGQFSFEVNDPITWATPVLRHNKGANILFIDGHATNVYIANTINKALKSPNQATVIKTWESEYTNASGTPVDAANNKTIEAQGLRRNPDMPLVWSDPPKLYR